MSERLPERRDGNALAPLVADALVTSAGSNVFAFATQSARPLIADGTGRAPLIASAAGMELALADPLIADAAADAVDEPHDDEAVTLAFGDDLLSDGQSAAAAPSLPGTPREQQDPTGAMASLGGLALFLAFKAHREAGAGRRLAGTVRPPTQGSS